MNHMLAAALVALALGMWGLGWMLGGTSSFALAIVMSSPLLALAGQFWLPMWVGGSVRAVKALAYRDIEGRHFEFKGRPVMVREDLDGARWLRTRDIQKVLPAFPRDALLQRIFPDALGQAERKHGLFLKAQALDNYLRDNQDDTAIRFRNWLQRDVIFPAQRAAQLNRVPH